MTLPTSPVPAPGFSLTKGRKPRTGEAKLIVQFRYGDAGYIDRKHQYKADQINWTDNGSDWCPVAVRKA